MNKKPSPCWPVRLRSILRDARVRHPKPPRRRPRNRRSRYRPKRAVEDVPGGTCLGARRRDSEGVYHSPHRSPRSARQGRRLGSYLHLGREGRAKSYTYSVIEGQGTLHQGVFGAPEELPLQPDATPFPIAAVKTDTDAALNMALANGGYHFEKKTPRKSSASCWRNCPSSPTRHGA